MSNFYVLKHFSIPTMRNNLPHKAKLSLSPGTYYNHLKRKRPLFSLSSPSLMICCKFRISMWGAHKCFCKVVGRRKPQLEEEALSETKEELYCSPLPLLPVVKPTVFVLITDIRKYKTEVDWILCISPHFSDITSGSVVMLRIKFILWPR